jgi:hypothetical protein
MRQTLRRRHGTTLAGTRQLRTPHGGRWLLGVLAACVVVSLLIVLAAAQSARADTPSGYVDGIADQNMGLWAGNYIDSSGFYNQPFYDFFAQAWVGNPPSHIRYARFVTAPNAIAQGGTCEQNLITWYDYVTQQLHLIPVIAVWDVAEGGCADDGVPSTANYTTDVQQLLTVLDATGTPLPYFEAWNEPNDSGVSATAAANLWSAANTVCAANGCTALAGDFVDSPADQGGQKFNPGCTGGLTFNNAFKTYETSYVKQLGSARPTIWAFHPYLAVNCEQSASLTTFADNLPSPAGQIWFTEVASWECFNGQTPARGTTRQQKDASYLVNTLMAPSEPGSPSHVFWYEIAAPGYTQNCAKYSDSALYEGTTAPGYIYARPAAATVFGSDSGLAAVSAPASAVSSSQATLNGSVTPAGIYEGTYYFRYGLTTAYGSQTASVQLDPGLSALAESAVITGLRPRTTYHFQIVATDTLGTLVYGLDEHFTTPSSGTLGASPVSGSSPFGSAFGRV